MTAVEDYARRHPKVVRWVTGLLVGWAVADLVAMVELHVRAGHLVAEAQRSASEALGG